MTPILTIISGLPSLELPNNLVGWLAFFFLAGFTIYLIWNWWPLNNLSGRHPRRLLIILVIAAPLAGLLIGVSLPIQAILPPPGMVRNPIQPVVMFFAAVPLFLSALTLGPIITAVVAALTYLPIAVWNTYSFFTPLELAFLGVLLSGALRQRYRTPVFRGLKIPIVAGALAGCAYPLVYFIFTIAAVSGQMVNRFDYALTTLLPVSLARGIELALGALVAQVLWFLLPGSLKVSRSDSPTPAERSLQTRFMASMMPLAFVLLASLILGNWISAGNAAQDMLHARMENAASISAENVSYFLETGQNLAVQLAQEKNLLSDNPTALQAALMESIQSIPFFNQLVLLNLSGETIASNQTLSFTGPSVSIDEQNGIPFAIKGAPQFFTLRPIDGQTTALVSFMAAVPDANGFVQRILLGRCDLKTNPLSKSILASLDNLAEDEVKGILLDEYNRILVHPDPELVMEEYTGRLSDKPEFFEDISPDGTRMFTFFQPAQGRAWSVVLNVPAERGQQIALGIALPMVAVIFGLFAISFFISRWALQKVTASLEGLTAEANRLAQGELNHPLSVEGLDEVGQLSRAFEQMRLSLKERLNELRQLLLVSQGVASSLEITEALQPVLEGVIARGASFARVILIPGVVQEIDSDLTTPTRYGLGPNLELYHDLDEQILAITRQQDRLVQANVNRPRMLNIPPDSPRLSSLIAVALRHENQFYGAMWAGYTEPHPFSHDEVQFLITLGGQAAVATANARLFLNSEIGRQRLSAILSSYPDPVLVTDQSDRLILANPAAWQALNLSANSNQISTIDQIIPYRDLAEMLRTTSVEKLNRDIALPDGRVFAAIATGVIVEGHRVGRVCVLRDVTHFKELDTLKTDFVSTVSHDLRSPLTLMRGYASMLEIVGELNEQQEKYIRKIVSGVESMSQLINNLLDLGRIEAGIGLQLEKNPAKDILDRVVGGLQLQAAQKRIQITVELPPQGGPLIEADQALLQQALHNLVENAIKYSRNDGKITVRVKTQASSVIFEVIDNGSGISPMDLPRLFEKFYRGAQQASKDKRGTGLGLAIVKSIAERHGGKVWVESKLGKGSTFSLEIPLRQSQTGETVKSEVSHQK